MTDPVVTTPGNRVTPLRRGGLTLLEMLVAMAIVAMIAAMLATSLSVAFRARRSAMNNLDQLRQARLAMDMIGRDLIMALPPTGVLAGAFTGTQDEGGTGLDSVTFYNTGPAGQVVQGGADVQQVTLAVLPVDQLLVAAGEADSVDERDAGPRLLPAGEAGQAIGGSYQVLVRRVTRRLLAQVAVEPANEVILRQVRSFRLRYYNGTDWLDAWDSTTSENTLPLAVELTLEVDRVSSQPGASMASVEPYTLLRVFALPAGVVAGESTQAASLSSQGGSLRQP